MPDCCELCNRLKPLTFHHLIPRTLHSNRWFKKTFTREQMQQGLNLCRACHRTVHDFLTEKELGRDYNTRERLLEHEPIGTFVKWVCTRPNV
ncbi:MAG: hypothetical protein O3B01_18360 [Planctomycetota bacterium]|nr:hypothetical protein [Planctomycetota bacterium]MDA1140536.1 hypothetical protein [Planctomycetota bacterium]